MQKRYFGEFDSITSIHCQFEIQEDQLLDEEVIIAVYSQEYYDGFAMVAFKREGKVFIAAGSHCSCYGLEGQFEPEEISLDALKHFFQQGAYLSYFEAADHEDVLAYIGALV